MVCFPEKISLDTVTTVVVVQQWPERTKFEITVCPPPNYSRCFFVCTRTSATVCARRPFYVFHSLNALRTERCDAVGTSACDLPIPLTTSCTPSGWVLRDTLSVEWLEEDITDGQAYRDQFTMPKTSAKYAEKCKPSTSTAGIVPVSGGSGPDEEHIVQTVADSKVSTFENLTRHEKLVKLSKKTDCQVPT